MNESFTNVVGEEALTEAVVRCWMSAWGQRVLAYRAGRKVTAETAIAVVVQRMVANSDRSGVLFTADPSTGDTSRIVIEAAFGLGEVVVAGQVEPDTYMLSRSDPAAIDVRIGRKRHKIVRGADGRDQRIELDDAQSRQRVLGNEELSRLRELGSAHRSALPRSPGRGVRD